MCFLSPFSGTFLTQWLGGGGLLPAWLHSKPVKCTPSAAALPRRTRGFVYVVVNCVQLSLGLCNLGGHRPRERARVSCGMGAAPGTASEQRCTSPPSCPQLGLAGPGASLAQPAPRTPSAAGRGVRVSASPRSEQSARRGRPGSPALRAKLLAALSRRWWEPRGARPGGACCRRARPGPPYLLLSYCRSWRAGAAGRPAGRYLFLYIVYVCRYELSLFCI